TILELQNLSRKYNGGNPAVKSINLQVRQHEKLALVGETGSGKSTLLKIASGLLSADAGKVMFGGQEIENPKDQLIPGHPDLAYLSQHFELPKFITVEQHLFDPYEMTEDEAQKIYNACQIEHLLSSDTRFLSGGEKQRVALAKLLLAKPQVLLLDEPYSNLDPIHKQIIKQVVQVLGEELSITIIMVSHEPLDVLPWADRIAVLRHGEIVQLDQPYCIYRRPVNEYVAGLFGRYNLLESQDVKLLRGGQSELNVNQYIVRPEDVRVRANTNGKNSMSIENVEYYGSYEQLTIALSRKKHIYVKVPVGQFHKGQAVTLHIK
ncbi:MAG: ABC transporter ATP-binding protein, partial [Bacteroidota bacterium]